MQQLVNSILNYNFHNCILIQLAHLLKLKHIQIINLLKLKNIQNQ